MIDENTRLKLADEASYQSLGEAEETVILSLKSGYLYTCNETTAAMLELADGRRALGAIVSEMATRYDVPRDELRDDLLAVAQKLVGERLLAIVE